jgi:hypothetical protein
MLRSADNKSDYKEHLTIGANDFIKYFGHDDKSKNYIKKMFSDFYKGIGDDEDPDDVAASFEKMIDKFESRMNTKGK